MCVVEHFLNNLILVGLDNITNNKAEAIPLTPEQTFRAAGG